MGFTRDAILRALEHQLYDHATATYLLLACPAPVAPDAQTASQTVTRVASLTVGGVPVTSLSTASHHHAPGLNEQPGMSHAPTDTGRGEAPRGRVPRHSIADASAAQAQATAAMATVPIPIPGSPRLAAMTAGTAGVRVPGGRMVRSITADGAPIKPFTPSPSSSPSGKVNVLEQTRHATGFQLATTGASPEEDDIVDSTSPGRAPDRLRTSKSFHGA